MSNRIPFMKRPQARARTAGAAASARQFWTVRALAPIGGQPVRAEIDIYGVIGEDYNDFTGQQVGVSAQAFLDAVRSLGPVDELTLNVNSEGGDAFDGSAIYGVLSQLSCRKVANIQGLCASAATVIVCACDEIRMSANALFMIHDPSTIVGGNAADLAQAQAMLAQLKSAMVTAYAAKNASMSDEDIAAAMAATTWYTAEEAKAAGWVDAVLEPVVATAFAGIDLKRFRGNVPEALAQAVAAAPAPEAEAEPAVEVVPPVVDAPPALTLEAVSSAVAEAVGGLRSEFASLIEGLSARLPAATASAAAVEVPPTAEVTAPADVVATPEQVDAASRTEIRLRAEENGLLSVYDGWVRTGATTAQLRNIVANAVAARQVNLSAIPEAQPERELPAAPKAELTRKVLVDWFDSLNKAAAGA